MAGNALCASADNRKPVWGLTATTVTGRDTASEVLSRVGGRWANSNRSDNFGPDPPQCPQQPAIRPVR
jgi:hypothetical protein